MPQKNHLIPFLFAAAMLSGCGEPALKPEDYGTHRVGMPNGNAIRAEMLVKPEDLMRGMMFRESLADDRGMLFLHGSPGRYPYWMYQVKIPLDIIWLDQNRRVVEISENTPPCPSAKASECPSYGGAVQAMTVLELKAGMAKKYGVAVGTRLEY
jgi:hypothetical protein